MVAAAAVAGETTAEVREMCGVGEEEDQCEGAKGAPGGGTGVVG